MGKIDIFHELHAKKNVLLTDLKIKLILKNNSFEWKYDVTTYEK